jgi:hypothetical protein
MRTTCTCGSGKPCWELVDARGIFCSYVCEDCEDSKRDTFRPEIFDDPGYEADEPIEPEE